MPLFFLDTHIHTHINYLVITKKINKKRKTSEREKNYYFGRSKKKKKKIETLKTKSFSIFFFSFQRKKEVLSFDVTAEGVGEPIQK